MIIDRVELLTDKKCLVYVKGACLQMSVRQALSQRRFAKCYSNDTNRTWTPVSHEYFSHVMRKRFEEAGYDFELAGRPDYGRAA